MVSVSVIIPVYRPDRELLLQALQSVLSQKEESFEILVMDDGNDEKDLTVIRQTAGIDGRIRVISLPHAGVSAARNAGVRNASGEFVVFLDADDRLTPWFFEEALSIEKEQESDIVIGGTVYQTEKNDKAVHIENPAIEVIREKEKIAGLKKMILGNVIRFENGGYFNRTMVGRLIRRSLAEKVPFRTDLALAEDRVWHLEILQECSSVTLVRQIWYEYRYNPVSKTNAYNPAIVEELVKSFGFIIRMTDLQDDGEYFQYVTAVIEYFRMVYACMYSRPEYRRLPLKRRKELFDAVYAYPFSLLGEARFFRMAPMKAKAVCILYRMRLLFQYWKISGK